MGNMIDNVRSLQSTRAGHAFAILFKLFDFRAKTTERKTGFEPATNSLEGCDSTTELLPQILSNVYNLFAKTTVFSNHVYYRFNLTAIRHRMLVVGREGFEPPKA